jgi:ABC-2 type transport system ATP-binding protein
MRGEAASETFPAINDVSFSVAQGESVGLMGLNGSGKSTLLKLVSGVMRPDAGQVRVRGRIAGLIEVGAGLHPDLTGRENIYLNGAILGMGQSEIDRKFDAIVDFSGVERFIDNEVRHYSSGMFARLGFSVAVHTEPDVFLVDEVLAVGDQRFRKRCLERIRHLHAQGQTLVIVSHNARQIVRLCSRALVLEDGELAFDGPSTQATEFIDAGEDDDDDDL